MRRSKLKDPIATSVRFESHVKKAIEKAAQDDARSASSLIQKVMLEWLRERKYLACAIALALALAMTPCAYAKPHKQITDAQRWDCLTTDHDPDGTEWCVKSGKGMTKAQIDAWFVEEGKRMSAEVAAAANEAAGKARAEEDKRIEAANKACASNYDDWKTCGDNAGVMKTKAYGEIAVACRNAADARARFGTPVWPSWGPFQGGPIFGDSALKTGIITVREDDATFQNQYGAMAHVVVLCSYNFNNQTAEVTIMEK
jgi:hypothetical protein